MSKWDLGIKSGQLFNFFMQAMVSSELDIHNSV